MLRVHYLHKRHGRPAREALIALEIRGHSFHDPFHATSGGRLLQPWASSDALGGRTFVSCREPASVSPLLSSDVDQIPSPRTRSTRSGRTSSPSSCAEPRCSMLREPRREEYTIRTATAPEASLRVHSGVGGELRFRVRVQRAGKGSQGSPARARVMASRAVRPWFAAESR